MARWATDAAARKWPVKGIRAMTMDRVLFEAAAAACCQTETQAFHDAVEVWLKTLTADQTRKVQDLRVEWMRTHREEVREYNRIRNEIELEKSR